jgi:PleD family two-component response regulator
MFGADPVEIFWDSILSREPQKILAAYRILEKSEQARVLAHLQRMVSEEGWHTEQRISAQTALQILQSFLGES